MACRRSPTAGACVAGPTPSGSPAAEGASPAVLFTYDSATGLQFAAFLIAVGMKAVVGGSVVNARFLVP